MRLVIQVSDDGPDHMTTETAQTAQTTATTDTAQAASSAPDGLADLPAMDGGPVPEILLSMESEVAAGQRPAPHLS